MKKIINTIIALVFPLMAVAQSGDENYIHTKTHNAPTTLVSPVVTESIKYYDGLGKPKQTVQGKAGGNGQDIITPIEYDGLGRQAVQYLPYADPGQTLSSLGIRSDLSGPTNTYYINKYPQDISANNPNPYNQTFFEVSSPLNRVTENAAPGAAWLGNPAGDNDHTIKLDYQVNSSREVRKFGVSFGIGTTEVTNLTVSGYYASGTLYKTITRDENWQPGQSYVKDNTTEEFKDKEGRIVLKRTYESNKRHDTFYVYDIFGNLTYVIPPLASDNIVIDNLVIQTIDGNFPWTKLTLVDSKLADDYNRRLADYDNSEILNADLIAEFGGQGGFSIVPSGDKVIVNLNITTATPMPYRNGQIVDLSPFGTFSDKELGRISGDGYDYFFLIQNNALEVSGSGNVPTINFSFTGEVPLEYEQNYPWTKLCVVDPVDALDYEDRIKNLSNAEILTTYTYNKYGAFGGVSVMLDEADVLTVSVNISANTPMEMISGTIFPLDIERSIADRDLGVVQGNYNGTPYSYRFSILNNNLVIDGSGQFINITHFSSQLTQRFTDIDQTVVNGLCYIYNYDYRNRVIKKHIPDNGWTYIVYDKLDRPVMTQDENLRLNSDWLFTKYDAFDRVIMTGKYTDDQGRDRFDLQADINNATGYLLSEEKSSTPLVGMLGGFYLYYTTDLSFPPSGELYTIQYYDDYFFDRDNPSILDLPDSVFDEAFGNAKGLPTISYTKIFDGTNYNWTASTQGYDVKGQLIFEKKLNTYLVTIDTNEIKLDFTGKPTISKTTHASNSGEVVFQDLFQYDVANRLLKQSRSINNELPQTIVFNHYDELGKLDQKKVGAGITTIGYGSTNALQTVDFEYNIRGWLKNINDPGSLGNDLFGFNIAYDHLYNGNISSTSWKNITDNIKKSYSYTYDALNRLTNAYYSSSIFGENNSEGPITYDKNGNIKSLQRWGYVGFGYDKMDILTYSYKPMSNLLLKVQDSSSGDGFSDNVNTVGNDYSYDLNGNMQSDLNKSIGEAPAEFITYNHLNLPMDIIKDSSHKITYIYDATGQKIEKQVINGAGNVTSTQYANGFVYENNVLQYFPHPEGYVQRQTNGDFSYVYQYKDHLGNVRLTYADSNGSGAMETAEIIEETDYYPFGMLHKNNVTMSGGNAVAQKIKYNGKELQDELGLGWYDYHARNYDPAIGRWFNIDPLAEDYSKISPYVYGLNNPIFFIDPDGRKIRNADEEKQKKAQGELESQKEHLANLLKIQNVSGTSNREIRKALGESKYKGYQYMQSTISSLESKVKKLAAAAKLTGERIDEFDKGANDKFKEMDNMKNEYGEEVDVLVSTDAPDGYNGMTSYGFLKSGNEIRLTSDEGKVNEINVHLGVIMQMGNHTIPTTLSNTKHEMGHANYVIQNTRQHYEYRNAKQFGPKYDGHGSDDPSGERARQWQYDKN